VACRNDGGLASFEVDPGVDFDSVDIRPITATPGDIAGSSFLISAFVGCATSASGCITSLALPSGPGANTCP
jgi:hypothetical protein